MTKSKYRRQVAALPVRRIKGELQVLMITSRRSGRWLIPKGWPMQRRTAAEAAAQEALEEAGVVGKVTSRPRGRYHYIKVFDDQTAAPCMVDVFVMKAVKQRDKWREKNVRKRRWMNLSRAARSAHEHGLADLLRQFARKPYSDA
ncbi:MAG: hydrolase [Devosia sp.]|uniref:NUDIX hydrolase n=1 Tax=Devosia sp. TaxID=1871048 RepID=UPI0026036620|nr:NUDIX hydrolase [Devosia sp.]MDB5542188.1 hydrolase [Devosia sp.]